MSCYEGWETLMRCMWCGRVLVRPESIQRRQGPVCMRKHGKKLLIVDTDASTPAAADTPRPADSEGDVH